MLMLFSYNEEKAIRLYIYLKLERLITDNVSCLAVDCNK